MIFCLHSNIEAQNLISTLEAESGEITLPAKIKYVNGYSGDAYVGDNDPGSSIVFNNVNILEAGTYEFRTYYTSMQLRSIAVKANNYPASYATIVNTTQDWNAPPTETISTYIYLNKGINTIAITPHPNGAGGPNVDKFEIYTTDYQLPQPGVFPIVLEAELAQLFGDLKVKPIDGSMINGLSGGKYIGDFHQAAKSHLKFVDIEIPEEGTYELKVFSMGSGRALSIKVNQYVKSVITTNASPNWDNAPASMASSYVYLTKGKNTITLGTHNDNGPNLDKIEIHKTTHTIPKPKVEFLAYVSSYADEAKIIAQHNNESIIYLNDNNEYTLYSINGVTTTQIIAKCKYPILLTGYLLSSGIEAEEDVTQWMLETSKDGIDWKLINPNSITNLTGAHIFGINRSFCNAALESAQYYRLTAKGKTDINVAEFQLFGSPYIENNDGRNFPPDITEGVNLMNNSSAFPIGASGESWSENYLNLFNRKLENKYFSNNSKQFYVEILLDKKFTLDSYTLTSVDNYPDRDPSKWTMSGYNDDIGWVELDRQVEFLFPARYATVRFDIENVIPFTKFLLDVEDNNGSPDIQLLKWQLFGKEYMNETGTERNLISDTYTIWTETGRLNIRQNKIITSEIEIFNLSGMLVNKNKFANDNYQVNLTSGIYIISIRNEVSAYNTKIIIK